MLTYYLDGYKVAEYELKNEKAVAKRDFSWCIFWIIKSVMLWIAVPWQGSDGIWLNRPEKYFDIVIGEWYIEIIFGIRDIQERAWEEEA